MTAAARGTNPASDQHALSQRHFQYAARARAAEEAMATIRRTGNQGLHCHPAQECNMHTNDAHPLLIPTITRMSFRVHNGDPTRWSGQEFSMREYWDRPRRGRACSRGLRPRADTPVTMEREMVVRPRRGRRCPRALRHPLVSDNDSIARLLPGVSAERPRPMAEGLASLPGCVRRSRVN